MSELIPNIGPIAPLLDLSALPENGGVFVVSADGAVQECIRPSIHQPDPNLFETLVFEAFRWGEASFRWVGDVLVAFAWPLTFNQQLLGGVVVVVPLDDESMDDIERLRQYAGALGQQLRRNSLYNVALMRTRQQGHRRERHRAEAIHDAKQSTKKPFKEVYWYLEPQLFKSMRSGKRSEARRLLNSILFSLYEVAGTDFRALKGFLLDLVTMMGHTVVDGGADAQLTMSHCLDHSETLTAIHDEEHLSRWVTHALEGFIDLVANPVASVDEDPRIKMIVTWLREHCHEDLSRDQVAKRLGLSPAYFSRLLKQSHGRSFSACLQAARLERAMELLIDHSKTLKDVAEASGFRDQGYFGKVFRKVKGMSPSDWRKQTQAASSRMINPINGWREG